MFSLKAVTGALLIGFVSSFVNQPSFIGHKAGFPVLFVYLEGKYFQLEEQEDKEVAITDVRLNGDHTVTFGETDGPLPIETRGTWQLNGNDFRMDVVRKFETGDEGHTESNLENRIGTFSFSVPLSLRGQITSVGGKTAVEGRIVSVDEKMGDREVGYFSMLDTTDDLLGEEK